MSPRTISTRSMRDPETLHTNDSIEHAVRRLIDSGLSELMHRELVTTDEVSDLLLDVRMLLTAAEMAEGAGVPVEPVGA